MVDLLQLDLNAFIRINKDWSNPFFDAVMPWVTHLADSVTVWFWIIFIVMLTGWHLARFTGTGSGRGLCHVILKPIVLFSFYLALIYGINAGVCQGLKHLSHHSRPFIQHSVVLRVSPETVSCLAHDGSFPSGHAVNAFMGAALIAQMLRRRRWMVYATAALVAYSRVYLGVHYPGDVIAGGMIGLCVTILILRLSPLRYRQNFQLLLNGNYTGKFN